MKEGFVRAILTTNFDRLTENALREAGVEPAVIRSEDDLSGAVPLIHSRCYVVKVHGDYLDTRIKNTDEELASYSPAMNNLLDRILDEHGLIVCGWSGGGIMHCVQLSHERLTGVSRRSGQRGDR